MADISEVVQVSITANTLAVSQQGFGIPLIVGVNNGFPERIRYYTNLAGVAVDFSADSPEYQAAALQFGQDVRPARVAIGRVLSSNEVKVTVANPAANNFAYTVYINGKKATYQSPNGATRNSIATGLANVINTLSPSTPSVTLPPYVIATPDGNGGIDIVPNTADGYGDYGIKLDSKLSLNQLIPSQTWVEALDDIENISDDWYVLTALNRLTTTQVILFSSDFNANSSIIATVNGQSTAPVTWMTDQETTMQNLINAISNLSTVSNVVLDGSDVNGRTIQITGLNGQVTNATFQVNGTAPQPTTTITNTPDTTLAIAAWVLGRKKLYLTATADPAVYDNPNNSTAYQIAANNNDRTVFLSVEQAAINYPENAYSGRMVPTQPGAATWAYKNLKGVVADDLTTNQSINGRTISHVNTYEIIGGIAVTRDGITSAGTYIDIRVGIDWLEARIQERVFQRIASLDKIPYTDFGIGIIEAELRAQLDQAVSVGLINDDYQIQVPKAADVSPVDKAQRLLPDVFFTATLTNAIHRVIIQGTVSF